MKSLPFVLSAILLLGVGCTQSIFTSSSDNSSQIEAIEEALPETTYVTSNDLLLFSAPSDWSVVQRDGGNASSIQIEGSTGTLIISIQRAQTFEGDAIVYETWLSENFDGAPTSTTTVDGYTFDVFDVSTTDDENRRALTAKVSGAAASYFIKISMPLDADSTLSSVVDTLVFNPSEEAQEGAQFIR